MPQETYIFEADYNSTNCSSGYRFTVTGSFMEAQGFVAECVGDSIYCYQPGTTNLSQSCIAGIGHNPFSQNTCFPGPPSSSGPTSYNFYCAVAGSLGASAGLAPSYLNPTFPSASKLRLVSVDGNTESTSSVDISAIGSVTNVQSSKLTQSQIISNAVHGQYGVATQMQVIFYGEYVAGYNAVAGAVVNTVNNFFTTATDVISDATGLTSFVTSVATDYYNWNAQFNSLGDTGNRKRSVSLNTTDSTNAEFSMNVYRGLNGQVLLGVNYENVTVAVFNATVYDQYRNIYIGTALFFNMTLTSSFYGASNSTTQPTATPTPKQSSSAVITVPSVLLSVLVCLMSYLI
jgi:hypothetical protein